MAWAFAECRSMRTARVLAPRRTSHASNGPGTPPAPFWMNAIRARRSPSVPARPPPITSECPPTSHVPEASLGRNDVEEFTGADPVEAGELRVHPLDDARPLALGAVSFLDGIEQWRVVGYGGITPIVRAHAAAAIRRRGPDRRLRPVAEAAA